MIRRSGGRVVGTGFLDSANLFRLISVPNRYPYVNDLGSRSD